MNRLRLELAEEAIIVDPHHRQRRWARPDGQIADLNEADVLITYRLEEKTVLFIDFLLLSDKR